MKILETAPLTLADIQAAITSFKEAGKTPKAIEVTYKEYLELLADTALHYPIAYYSGSASLQQPPHGREVYGLKLIVTGEPDNA